jgi:hypothetical protein
MNDSSHDRRSFLTSLAAGSLAASSAASAALPNAIPTVKLGKHDITRLIAGYNPIGGFSHSVPKLSVLMKEWFTEERVLEFIRRCEKNGITTWQSSVDKKCFSALRKAWDGGSKMQWICLMRDVEPAVWKEIAELKPLGVVHHGEVTDRLFNIAEEEQIKDFIKKAHGYGLQAGVSSHRPQNIAKLDDLNYGHDFYMACFHEIRRDQEKVKAGLGDMPIDELYLQGDPARMCEVVRKVKRTCLGVKILAAGRMCNNAKTIEKAFEFAFKNIKKTDAVIVGMFPIVTDEVAEDAGYARKYA